MIQDQVGILLRLSLLVGGGGGRRVNILLLFWRTLQINTGITPLSMPLPVYKVDGSFEDVDLHPPSTAAPEMIIAMGVENYGLSSEFRGHFFLSLAKV